MLKRLQIENIILVESTSLEFGPKLNVMTGETGSGKSAILQSLGLALGRRADCTMVRRGAERGVVEAYFDIQDSPEVLPLLEKAGIEGVDKNSLLIRREVSAQGKSRSFINDQLVHLSLLRELGPFLLDIVSQHASQTLQSLDAHRGILDGFARLHPLRESFSAVWTRYTQGSKELDRLQTEELTRQQRMDLLHREIEEIEAANPSEDEEEVLFQEYTRLANAEGITESMRQVYEGLAGDEGSVISGLRSLEPGLEGMAKMDAQLQEVIQTVQSARLELEEVAYTLNRYAGGVEQDPARMEALNDRLALLRHLKRQFGPSISDVLRYLDTARRELEELEQAENHIEILKERLKADLEEANQEAKTLTQRRQAAARILEQHLTVGIRELNMPQAMVEVRVEAEKRSTQGDDRVELWLSPNVGEKLISARDCASGGEQSRLLLVIKTLLSKKEQIPALVFDEIDSNIGGETAALVGERLKALGKEQQVLCITHFPQVAQQAHHHLKITKEEIDGRTVTKVSTLHGSARQSELTRMLGGQEVKAALTSA